MYVPKIFTPKDATILKSYVQKYSFATLVSQINGLVAAHIPLLWLESAGENYITGHIAKANDLSKCFDQQQELLAIFMNSHAYISSSWYDHINVPTWNYIAVHIYGSAKRITGRELYESIEQMVDKYESARANPFKLADLSPKELDNHMNGLIGFKMTIHKIEASYKLSQNRNDRDHSEIVTQLKASGTDLELAIAQEMEALR